MYNFNEAETEETPIKAEPELQVRVSSHSRKKSRKRNIDDLPETVVEHDIEDKATSNRETIKTYWNE